MNLGVTYAASDMVEVFGKVRRHTRDAGGPGISSTLFALGVTLYPTGQKPTFSTRSFTPGGQFDY